MPRIGCTQMQVRCRTLEERNRPWTIFAGAGRAVVFGILLGILFAPSYARADYQAGLDYYLDGNYELALKEWQAIADHDPAARHAIGTLYLDGLGVQNDAALAFSLIESAAKDQYIPAIGLLGVMYREGIGTKTDLSESLSLLTIAAENNDTASIYQLAITYLYGIGIDVNETRARELIESILDTNDPDAIILYASAFLAPGIGGASDTNRALELLLVQAKNGVTDAAYALGEIYSHPQYGIYDAAKAIEWYTIPADSGDGWAQLKLGNLIIETASRPEHFDEGIKRLEQAANSPDDVGLLQWAHYDLAEALLATSNDAADIQAAISHYETATEYGSGFAASRLGDIYLYGDLASADFDRALDYYEMALELGVETSLYNLGWLYFYHRTDDPSHQEKAIDYWIRGAALNDPFCLEWLGRVYLDGNGVELNYRTSEEYLDRASAFWRSYPEFETGDEYAVRNYLRVLQVQAITKLNLGEYQEIEGKITEAFELYKIVPSSDDSRSQLLTFATVLSSAYGFTGRFEAAHEILDSTRDILDPIDQYERFNIDIARVFVLEAEGRFSEMGPHIDSTIQVLSGDVSWASDYFSETEIEAEIIYLSAIRVRAYLAEGKVSDARRLFLDELVDYDEAIVFVPTKLRILLADAYLTLSEGEIELAFRKFNDLVERTEEFGLRHHGLVMVELGSIASAFEAHGDYSKAVEFARHAAEIYVESAEGTGPYRKRVARQTLETYIRILASLISSSNQPGYQTALIEEAFETQQLLGNVRLAGVLEMAAARFAGDNPELADLLTTKHRLAQDILRQGAPIGPLASIVAGSERMLPSGPGRPFASNRDNERQQGANDVSANQWLRVSAELRKIDTEIESKFPEYANIANPLPVRLVDAQSVLGDNEALIMFLTAQDNVYIWAINSSEAEFVVSSITSSELFKTVDEVRKTLDQGNVLRLADLKPFSVSGAESLYDALIAPVKGVLNDKDKIIIIPDGPLWSIPFEVFVEDRNGFMNYDSDAQGEGLNRNAEFSAYREIQWFGSNLSISYLPAVRSLVSLRSITKPSSGSKAFVGFGAPNFTGPAGARGSGVISSIQTENGGVDLDAIRRLPALPETQQELIAISESLGGSKNDLFFGSQAAEQVVRRMPLQEARVLGFATHALIAGELQGLQEPAIVLSPPDVMSESDDGLLTATEIGGLELNADIVILSACNTAAPDIGPIADGLSGLAESFFLAGARRMLVTHWSVFSESAVELTTTLVTKVAENSSTTYSTALAAAIIAVREDPDRPYFSHPAFWGPYIVVGVD